MTFPKKKVVSQSLRATAEASKAGSNERTVSKLNSTIKSLQTKLSKLNSELKEAERKKKAVKIELQRLTKQRDSLKRSLMELDRLRKRKNAELKTVGGELAKSKHALESLKQELKKTVTEKNGAVAEAAKARKEVESLQKQAAELKKSSDELSASYASLQANLEEVTSKIRDLQLTAALSDFFLSADIDGLEKWIVQDTPLVLEYLQQVRDKPYFDVYREYLYSRLLKKAYRFYECLSCRKRFRAESGEPKNCPFCGSSQLKLIDVAKEVVEEPPSSRLVLPKPEERQQPIQSSSLKAGADVADL